MHAPAPLAVSLGDPAGIGPELLCEAWARRSAESLPPFYAAGGANVLAAAAERRGLNLGIARISAPEEAVDTFATALPVLGPVPDDDDCEYRPGQPDSAGAKLALESLKLATRHAVSGTASALVTGPIAKSHLAHVGFIQPGQTEFVADACQVTHKDAVMMLAGPSVRTVPLTVHVALADVPGLITRDLIERRARIVSDALQRDFGIERPRLAICGLNPHAGEDGRFGDEEARIIIPAIDALRKDGLHVTGPHPADALFAPHERSRYDAALCMYHDQALIPVKALDFDQGVNITLGLPIVRTSPDHGTAFAIAGTGKANAGATVAAIRMAGECAARRRAQ